MGWKAAQKLLRHWKILRGDNVMIIRGKDNGENGVIKRVICTQNRVIVEGKNLVRNGCQTGQVKLHTGEENILSKDKDTKVESSRNPCKIGIRYLEDGSKVRVSRGIGASASIILRPEILKIRATPRPTVGGPKDTPMDVVVEKTYDAKTGRGMPGI